MSSRRLREFVRRASPLLQGFMPLLECVGSQTSPKRPLRERAASAYGGRRRRSRYRVCGVPGVAIDISAMRPEGVSMLRLVSTVCWLPMTYFSESPRNVVRGEDRKEIAGSTTIFSDLTGDRLRGTYEER